MAHNVRSGLLAHRDAAQVLAMTDRFYKGPSSHGSGLGLTIARNLVVSHGGDISAESRVGEGTTVTFTLPRVAA